MKYYPTELCRKLTDLPEGTSIDVPDNSPLLPMDSKFWYANEAGGEDKPGPFQYLQEAQIVHDIIMGWRNEEEGNPNVDEYNKMVVWLYNEKTSSNMTHMEKKGFRNSFMTHLISQILFAYETHLNNIAP